MIENQLPKAIQFDQTTDNVQNIKEKDTTYHNVWPVNTNLFLVSHFEQNQQYHNFRTVLHKALVTLPSHRMHKHHVISRRMEVQRCKAVVS